MDLLEAGKIVNTHGLRGEVKIVTWTDYPEQFEDIDSVYVKSSGGYERLDIRSVKYQRGNIIVKFAQISDIDEAQTYKNKIVYAEREALGPLEEGVYYIADLIGLDAISDAGENLGRISDVFNNGASDIYEVRHPDGKKLLLPVIDEVILNVDLEGRRVTVHMMEGLDEI